MELKTDRFDGRVERERAPKLFSTFTRASVSATDGLSGPLYVFMYIQP